MYYTLLDNYDLNLIYDFHFSFLIMESQNIFVCRHLGYIIQAIWFKIYWGNEYECDLSKLFEELGL